MCSLSFYLSATCDNRCGIQPCRRVAKRATIACPICLSPRNRCFVYQFSFYSRSRSYSSISVSSLQQRSIYATLPCLIQVIIFRVTLILEFDCAYWLGKPSSTFQGILSKFHQGPNT
ncbi:hypothetical protein CPB83DRAFT_850828 [Crepidotus variabilis]|uniref:Uncharacterized protein n=1 Tax=Crepidotus variabilis TaxID=179855 RepID=A0A9P6EJT4_9AGAR|nr:hypothetical protein CPB83DRAFT_850828 [Crepidotus variabilis]